MKKRTLLLCVGMMTFLLSTVILGEDTSFKGITLSISSHPEGKQISKTHFAAGAGFYLPGIYYGTLPADNPENKREEFAEVLRKSGIRALRFPNGNESQYYLYDGKEATWELKGSWIGNGWQPHRRPEDHHFVNAFDLLRFCKDYDFDVVYQLPTFFYYDGNQPRAITMNNYVDLSWRQDLYDHDRIEEAAAYIEPLVKFCRENEIPVACWEFGNEEFGHMSHTDFAKIIKAYTEVLDRYYENPKIAFALQGPEPGTKLKRQKTQVVDGKVEVLDVPWTKWWVGWPENLLGELTRMGLKERLNRPEVHGTMHYSSGPGLNPKTIEDRTNHALLLKGDLSLGNSVLADRYTKLGFDKLSVGLTETNAAKNHKWDHFVINPSYAYGLSYVQYWISLLKQPKITICSLHCLETTFFGIMRFGVIYDAETKRFVHTARLSEYQRARVPKEHWFGDSYVLSGACYANGLLSKLAGCRLDMIEISAEGNAQKTLEENQVGAIAGTTEEGRHVVVIYNKTDTAFPLTVHFPEARARNQYVLTARSISSMLEKDLNLEMTSLRVSKKADMHLSPFSVVAIEE